MLNIKIKKVTNGATIPKYSREGDSALDLYSTDNCVILPEERQLIHTGVAISLPDEYCALILPRSGNATKYGISIVNSPGLIDSNYRGEIMVCLLNNDRSSSFEVKQGDRIAQMLILNHPTVNLQEVDELDETNRNDHGFGSSGR